MRLPRTVLVFLLLTALPTVAQERLKPSEAKDHIGKRATVCGVVASARYAASSTGQPTFLNLDKPYPNPTFTLVIWGRNRAKFGSPETEYKDKSICVTGTITEYRGTPQIEASDPSQIQVEGKKAAGATAPSSAVTSGARSQTAVTGEREERTVYITRTGARYHAATCSSLSRSKIPISLKDAKARGYTACARCGGG